uniref:hypothetical protein n=1 Tax=Ornithinimicrobium sufpigmenti TaxID=2508882 RepID=UPI0037CA2613
MITDFLISVGFAISDALLWLLGSLPIPGPESALGVFFTDLGTIFSGMASMGNWIPFDVAGPAIVVLYLAAVAMFSIRIMRSILSLVTGGGGSAA